ncbi:ribbon-helix-helix domain-containing protein [Bifidobacterium avesanii]|uniref:Ribbon-helix-helix protein, CopG family n=1 Tax=Bifidobacterium avesanii TaxID=1798157 RepID=A0A7K3TJL7_9BIFI|nr:ribbon-helix-helix domain-containing protein [Bifidobacterium avesanii]KAB8287549.1 hypothetical protein DSM100685_1880 [Bifidobacterium avesanii]NEG79317.1 ribbon-helix-helix protein, CopG family [Bifidobacterium avesanii]
MTTHNGKQSDKDDTSPQGTPVILEDGTVFHNADGSVWTEEELEAQAEAFERGEWPKPGEWGPVTDGLPPEARGPVEFVSLRGRPKIAPQESEPAETVSFKLPHAQLEKLDRVAKAHGRTRSELLRLAVDRVLEFA